MYYMLIAAGRRGRCHRNEVLDNREADAKINALDEEFVECVHCGSIRVTVFDTHTIAIRKTDEASYD